jgi:hypothetical protein
VERDTLAWWQSLRQPVDAQPRRHGPSPWFELQAELVLALARAGVPLLVGTDTPNPMLVPGFSIHDELEALVAAGLTRAEVLRAATVRAALLLACGGQGRIVPGQSADLLLLDGDPLASLEPLASARRVRGRSLARRIRARRPDRAARARRLKRPRAAAARRVASPAPGIGGARSSRWSCRRAGLSSAPPMPRLFLLDGTARA